MLIYSGQEVTTNNWFNLINPDDPRFYNIKVTEYTPKSLEQIESDYNIQIVIDDAR